jgi:hypothetical protein
MVKSLFKYARKNYSQSEYKFMWYYVIIGVLSRCRYHLDREATTISNSGSWTKSFDDHRFKCLWEWLINLKTFPYM